MEQLVHVVYASAAASPMSGPALSALLEQSRRSNELHGLTGMLLYAEGSFFQVLEGSPDTVAACYAKIAADDRHGEMTKIIEEPIKARSFAGWSMGFSPVTLEQIGDIAGANDFFSGRGGLNRLDGVRAKKLLAGFTDGRWRMQLEGHRDDVAA